MTSEWQQIEIGKVLEINPYRAISRGQVTPFIPMNALPENARSVTYIDEREYTGSGTKFRNGDTLLARITPCLENGKTAFVSGLPEGAIAHGSTEYIVLTGKPSKSDNLFAYYFARLPDFRQYAIGHMEGTSGRQRVPSVAVENYVVSLPPISEQRSIAHILGTLDDKIEINHHINETLEAITKIIFKSWFVDFDPVRAKASGESPASICHRLCLTPDQLEAFPNRFQGSELGEIPEGWDTTRIGDFVDVVDYVANGSFASLKEHVTLMDTPGYALVVRTTDFNSGFSGRYRFVSLEAYNFLKKSSLDGSEVIISNVGDVGTVFRPPRWIGWPMTLGSNAIALKCKEASNYLYSFFIDPRGQGSINSIVTGSAQMKFNKTNFRDLRIVKPDDKILFEFEKNAQAFVDQQNALLGQNQTLENIRDTLLPRLISGEIRVPV